MNSRRKISQRHFSRPEEAVTLVLLCSLFIGGCSTVNFDANKKSSVALEASPETTLGNYNLEWLKENGVDKSVFYPLQDGTDALGARLRLIDAAQKSIDLQYFLMKDDVVGALFSAKLLQVADRGVRVRFLLDDIFTTIKDESLYVLNAHENIEVRLFNPISRRGFQNLNYLGDFNQANRRMHNKSFTVDGSFSIVGGRNIAEEYFSLKENSEFYDLDVLVQGAVVSEIAHSFDEFWNHAKSVPIELIDKAPDAKQLLEAQTNIDRVMQSRGADVYQGAVNSKILNGLIAKDIAAFPAEARLISESPQKVDLPTGDNSMRLGRQLGEVLLGAKDSIIIFTPYFIPTSQGMEFWQEVAKQGIQLTLITNSLASTNHVPVHAAYERYRKGLLQLGFDLYEVRPDAARIIKNEDQVSTLHTKLIVIDHRYTFIGSLNMDPRSVVINTEMGILIDSPDLADQLLDNTNQVFETVVYKLKLNAGNKVEWHGVNGGKQIVYDSEPQTSWWRRFTAKMYKLLPEGQL